MINQGGLDRVRPFFLDIFSGEEGVARCLRARHLACKTFDIRQGASGDIASRSVLRRILGLIGSGNCMGIMMHIPCTTCSQARHPALRSHKRPRGLPGLSGNALAQLHAANYLYDHCFTILEKAERHRVPWMVENPRSSILWSFAEFKRLGSLPHVETARFDMCGYGTPWKKATQVMASRFLQLQSLCRVCRPVGRLCSHSGREHIVLSGRDPQNVLWTRRAQVYPKALCSALASLLHQAGLAKEFRHSAARGARRELWRVWA